MSNVRTHTWQNGPDVKKDLLHPKRGKRTVYRRVDTCVECGIKLGYQREEGTGHYMYLGYWQNGVKGLYENMPKCSSWKGADRSNAYQHAFVNWQWRNAEPKELAIHKLTKGMVRYVTCDCGLVRKDVKGHFTAYSRRYSSYYGADLSQVCPPCPLYDPTMPKNVRRKVE